MTPAADPPPPTMSQRRGLVVGWLAAFSVCGWFEGLRILQLSQTPAGPLAWFATWNHDTSLPLLVLAALPLLMLLSRRSRSTSVRVSAPPRIPTQRFPMLPTLLIGLLAFCVNASIGLRSIQVPATVPSRFALSPTVPFYSLPPAYHDEFSYLLQARTFLAGRVSWPAMTVGGDAFHQIHVLNRPVTASRYFPWTGAWIAPFLALGLPMAGHWLAGAFAAALFHRVLQRLVSGHMAFTGGLLLAASPGLAVFSNLLLAHQPTLLALAVFLYAFRKLQITGRSGWSWLAGTALTCSMLGRPMTAAGFAAPFGLWLLTGWLRQCPGVIRDRRDVWRRLQPICSVAMGFAVPLAAGFLVLALFNLRITGHWNESPYQLYTETWTPRHRFGFQNAVQPPQPGNVLARYDAWAENLTLRRALQNVQDRLVASSQWTLGLAALLTLIPAAGTALLCRQPTAERTQLRLIAASVFSLHLVHVPYWYDGILHWHYVFETAPLLLLLATAGLEEWQRGLQSVCGARLAHRWLIALLLSALLPAWLDAEMFWGPSRVSLAVSEQAWSRSRMEVFQRTVRVISAGQPCLILVDERSGDQQLSYIVNPPDYSGAVLVARLPETAEMRADLQQHFSDRAVWTFRPDLFQFTKGFPAGSDLRPSDR
ncbi:MAG: hypothetical protein ACKO2P_13760 [Planctomycetota bacterium]